MNPKPNIVEITSLLQIPWFSLNSNNLIALHSKVTQAVIYKIKLKIFWENLKYFFFKRKEIITIIKSMKVVIKVSRFPYNSVNPINTPAKIMNIANP